MNDPAPDGVGEGLYVVVSHSCDVVGDDFQREPRVELVPCVPIAGVDGNLTFGKNPRRLHIEANNQAYEISLVDRLAIRRELLAGYTPVSRIPNDDLRMFAAWLGSRYSRSAFADEFNLRCAPVMRKVESRMKRSGAYMSGIYLAVSSDELPREIAYDVVIQVSMRENDFTRPDLWANVNEATEEIGELLDSVSGINVVHAGVRSEAEIPISDLRLFQRWDYQYLSYRESDDESLPVAN